jgi:hypothetical protein
MVNSNNTGVTAWMWRLESVPLGSAVATGVISNVAAAAFTPDVEGSYLVSCRVIGANTNDSDTDYRVFRIVNAMGWIVPAFRGKGYDHNFGGQLRGWAGTATYKMLDSMFKYISDMLAGAAEGDLLTYSGGVWGPASNGAALLHGQTTDAVTSVKLLKTGVPDHYILPVPATVGATGFQAIVSGVGDGPVVCMAVLNGSVQRGALAASTNIVDQTVDYVVQTNPTMTVTAVADTVLGGLCIEVTGVAATDINWTASVQMAEAYFPVL